MIKPQLLSNNEAALNIKKEGPLSMEQKLINKINPPQQDEYYEKLEGKPSIYFYKCLSNTKVPLDKIYLNIPRTFFNNGLLCQIYTTEQGNVAIDESIDFKYFTSLIMKNKSKNTKHFPQDKLRQLRINAEYCQDGADFENEIPIAFLKGMVSSYQCYSELMDIKMYKDRTATINLSERACVQEFLYPPGKATSLIRYIYYSNDYTPTTVLHLLDLTSVYYYQ